MKIAILKERRPHETRVAATPETVKKLKALGVEEIVIETGAGVAAAYTDEAYAEAGAMIVPDAASAAAAADVIFKIQRPDGGRRRHRRARPAAPGPGADVAARRADQQGPGAGAGVQGRDVLRARADPAHHPRAVDGHPELAGQPRGLQGGPGGGQPVRPHLPADDDAGRHARALARLHHGRGRGGPAGDRHGAPAGLDRDGDRRAAGHQGAGAVARRQVRRRRGRGVQGGRDRGRLRQGDERGVSRQAGRAGGRPHQDARTSSSPPR